MIVVGGAYTEVCITPEWHRIFGSGSRAALAITSTGNAVQFHTYACEEWAGDIEQTMGAAGIESHITRIKENITFSYFHPLSDAHLSPSSPARQHPLQITGKSALRLGFVEGDAVVKCRRAVFDPQGVESLARFENNGSSADQLAYVLNEHEILALTLSETIDAAANSLLRDTATEVVVVKRGPFGAQVFEKGGQKTHIPSYRSDTVFKIGSGDVFTAIFAGSWADRGINPIAAAEYASRATAYYVNTRNLVIPPATDLAELRPIIVGHKIPKIYLAGPFFTISNRWLVEEALHSIEAIGVSVFSPLHDVGFGNHIEVATKDLDGLKDCTAVLALLDGEDPGTLFEIGYARRSNIPVIAFGENLKTSDLTMFVGSGCEFVTDFASAIYRAVWAAVS